MSSSQLFRVFHKAQPIYCYLCFARAVEMMKNSIGKRVYYFNSHRMMHKCVTAASCKGLSVHYYLFTFLLFSMLLGIIS
jgi:hypothetical protein